MSSKAITTFVILALIGVAFFVLLWPKIGEIQGVRGEVSDKSADGAIIKERVETTRKAISQFQGLSDSDINMVESALPNDVDLPNLFVLIQSLISSAGLIGEDIRVGEDSGGVSISFTLRGGYESLKAFLSEAEKSLRIFDLESITFTSSGARGGDENSFIFGLKMKTYINK